VWPQIVEQIVFNGLLIVLVLTGMGLPAYTIAIWARSISGTIVMLYLSPFWPKLVFDWGSFKQSIKYGVKFQANDLLARIKDQLFYLFIAKRVSLVDFGMISFAKNWSMYPYNLTVQNIMSITFPTFSRLQEHKEHLGKAIEKTIFFITLAIFPILVGMCLFFYPLTQVIEAYRQWEGAFLSFVCFTLSIVPVAISNPLINVLNATGKINKTLGLMVLWTLMTWGLTLPLVNVIGFNGVAVSALAISLTSFLPVVMVKRDVPFRLGEQVWRQAVESVAMVIGCVPLMSVWTRGLSWTITGGVMAAVMYGGVLWVTGRKKIKAELKSLRE
jgi:O-antigen/teichoic acid export membrane protein